MHDGPILIIAGTNRPGSNALKLARILEGHYRSQNTPIEIFSLAELPAEVFDPSSYAHKPAAFVPIQHRILHAGGLHIVTPEYNGSFPGVLKYFIDMLKFPETFESKPVAFVGEGGMWGGLRPVEHLMQIFSYRNAHIFPERVFIQHVKEKVDAEGRLGDAGIDARLAKQSAGFAHFVKEIQQRCLSKP